MKSLQDQIKDILLNKNKPLSIEEIQEETGKSFLYVRRIICQMIRNGKIEKIKTVKFRMTSKEIEKNS